MCRLLGLTSLLLVLLAGSAVQAQIVAHDASGQAVVLRQPARRVITLAPSTTELVYAAGGGGQMVGTVNYSDYPAQAKQLPQVGGLMGVSAIAILRLHPDLVVAWQEGIDPRLLKQLRAQGVPVYLSHPVALEDVAEEIRSLGRLLGTGAIANQQSREYLRKLAGLSQRYQHLAPVSVFFQVSAMPLFTVSNRSFIGSMITRCGGRNVFATLASPAPQVSREAVVAARPQVMLANQSGEFSQWDSWKVIPAVAKGTRYVVDADLTNRPGPRLLEGMSQVCLSLNQARTRLGLTPR